MSKVSARITTEVVVNYEGAGLSAVNAKTRVGSAFALLSGAGNGKVNKEHASTRPLAGAASENLDLAGGVTDPVGATTTFTKVRAIYIKANPNNVGSMRFGGAASNAFNGPFGTTVDLAPGDEVLVTNINGGWAVTAGTGDIFKALNLDATHTNSYDIVIIGE